MAQSAIGTSEPSHAAAAIDRDHLRRMALGDRRLERELLGLFDRQATNLVARMRSDPAAMPALAHTLKGSALGIGAIGVAEAAAALEAAVSPPERERALAALADAVAAARAGLARLLEAG